MAGELERSNYNVQYQHALMQKSFKSLANENLSSLTRSDLQPFGSDLKELSIGGRNIEVIPVDLFEYSRNLEDINLNNNKIKIVERGAFSKLQKLTKLDFLNNTCHSGIAENRADVLSLITQIESRCTEYKTIAKDRNQYATTTKVPTTTMRNFVNELNTCKKEKGEHEIEIEKLKVEFDNLQELKGDLQLKVDAKIKELELQVEAEKAKNAERLNIEASLKIQAEKLNENFEKMMAKIAEKLEAVKDSIKATDVKLTTGDLKFENLERIVSKTSYLTDEILRFFVTKV